MKKTFQDKLREKVNSWYRKKPQFRLFYKAVVIIALFFYHVGLHFINNGKRYLCALAAIAFFFINGSFIFYDNGEVIHASAAEKSDISLVTEEDIDTNEVEKETSKDMDSSNGDFGDVTDNEGEDSFSLEDIYEEHAAFLDSIESDGEIGESAETEKQDSVTFDKSDWKLMLVNKQHPIPDDYTYELATIKDWMKCDSRILEDLLHMMKDASDAGYPLAINSSYRLQSDQVYLFDRKINKYMNLGMSYMDAYKTAAYAVTLPGASEHQLGLALDIVGVGYPALDEAFGDTKTGQWLRDNAHNYGFILRYPKGKEYITSIEYEPWHFRYVGVDAADIIYENDLCLEEFWDQYLY